MSGSLPKECIIGVIGAGTMGSGIAQVAAAAGHPVILHDVAPGAAEAGRARLAKGLEPLVAKSRIPEDEARAIIGRIAISETLPALSPCGLVIEAIVERLEAKQQLFLQLEAVLPETAILATNTSSISVTAIGAALARPQALVGMHFFNPAPVMKLVEVVSGLATDPAVAACIHATAAAWGKKPVHARSTPGFIVNRVARPYYAEALRLVEEGAAPPALVDRLLTAGAGFLMGPFRLMDLIGNDVNAMVTRVTFDAFFGDARYRPSLLQGEYVAAGRLGRKSGRGFYDYAPETDREADAAGLPSAAFSPLACGVKVTGDPVRVRELLSRLAARSVPLQQEGGDGPACLSYGAAQLMLTDGRPATLRAAPGQTGLVVFDLADDYARVCDLAFATQDGAEPRVAADATALLAAAGICGHRIDDTPGLVVARTLAMLVNEACDALLAGIATREEIDTAMRFGLNFPRGPFEWTERLGATIFAAILDGLVSAYGDDRYRASVRLRRLSRQQNSAP